MPSDTTVGRLVLEDALPQDVRPALKTLTKRGLNEVLTLVAKLHPDQYKDVAKRLQDAGARASYESGGYSFGVSDMRPGPRAAAEREQYRQKVRQILADGTLPPERRDAALVTAALEAMGRVDKAVLEEHTAAKNPLALQVASGAKGSSGNLRALVTGDMLYADSNFKPIPYPVLHSFADGLKPWEYVAAAFGARKSIIDTKLGTASGGYFAKRLSAASHRLVVTAPDAKSPPDTTRGLATSLDDPDNEGALLAAPVGPLPRNTVLDRDAIDILRKHGVKRVLVRSPMVGGPADGGVYGHDVGVRERGRVAPVGDYVGLTAAQVLAEPITQLIIGSKHSGGVVGSTKTREGFPVIDYYTSIPQAYAQGATHAQADGVVTGVRPAPQGGHYVAIDGKEHYVRPEQAVTVKPGDHVEAGDTLSDGVPSPAEFVTHKGVGEGRRRWADLVVEAARNSGLNPHRRNVELVARGLVDHVRLEREYGPHSPGDVVSYTAEIESGWTPRAGSQTLSPKEAVGYYLEKPVLHYSIGTKVAPSHLPLLEEFGVKDLTVHKDPPPFTPVMVRSHDVLSHDKDPFTQMLGSNLTKNLLSGVARGAVADPAGTSFVPALAEGVHFGQTPAYKTTGWDAGKK